MHHITVAADLIALLGDRIVLIERKNPPFGLALPGGRLDEGESLEQAAARELMEETCLKAVRLAQFRTYSTPGRDPRGQSVSTVFLCEAQGEPRAADDAKATMVIGLAQIERLKDRFAFDHYQILRDAEDAIQDFLRQGHN